MGRVVTPTFRLEVQVVGDYGRTGYATVWTAQAWRGRATVARLVDWVKGMEASTREGGVNAHLGETTIRSAEIIRQSTGDTVATYRRSA
jgi:hypothetical protein